MSTEAAHEQDFGGVGGAIKAGLYGGARGLTLGLSDLAFQAGGASAEHLRGLEEAHPITSTVGELGGALLPGLAKGGESLGAKILARTPAGAVSDLGHAITGNIGASTALGRAGASTLAAAAEGSLYGGGDYLSQVALEDKPLSAEGFVGAMGKGALFAAPIGGGLSLGADALQRARSLFPRSEVTKEAAQSVKADATAALSQSVADGEQMLNAARRRVALTEAKGGMAMTTDGVVRRTFGAGDPEAMLARTAAEGEAAQLKQAIGEYTASKQELEDWIKTEADPDLERALLGMRSEGVQVGEPGHGRVSYEEPQWPAEIPTAAGQRAPVDLAALDATRNVKRPGAFPEGTPVEARPEAGTRMPPEPIDALRKGPSLTAAESTRVGRNPAPRDPTLPDETGLERIVRLQREASGEETGLEQIVRMQREAAGEETGLEGVLRMQRLASEDAPLAAAARRASRRPRVDIPEGFSTTAESDGVPVFDGEPSIRNGVPSRRQINQSNYKTTAFVVKPSELADHDVFGLMADAGPTAQRTASVLEAWRSGAAVPAIEVDIDKAGRYFIASGNKRLLAAAEAGDRPVLVRFRPIRGDIAGMDKMSGAIREAIDGPPSGLESIVRMQREAGRAATEPIARALTDSPDLEALLRGTKEHLDKGESLRAIGDASEERAKYIADKADKTRVGKAAHAGEPRKPGGLDDLRALVEGMDKKPPIGPMARPDRTRQFKNWWMLDRGKKDAPLPEAWWEKPQFDEHYGPVKPPRRVLRENARLRKLVNEVVESAPKAEAKEAAPTLRREVDAKERRPAARPRPRSQPRSPQAERVITALTAAASSASPVIAAVAAPAAHTPAVHDAGEPHSIADTTKAIQKEMDISHGEAKKLVTELKEDGLIDGRGQVTKVGRIILAADSGEISALEDLVRMQREVADDLLYVGEAPRPRERTVSDEEILQALERQGLDARPRKGPEDLQALVDSMPKPADRTSLLGRRALRDEGGMPVSPAEYEARAALGRRDPDEVARRILANRDAGVNYIDPANPNEAIAKALSKHNGKNKDISGDLARAAKVIGDHEEASAKLVDILGTEAPPSAVAQAKAYRQATAAQGEAAGASAAKAAGDIKDKVIPAVTAATGGSTEGVVGKLANVGTALEVLKAMGVHVPSVAAIPVIGPVLSLYLKARAALGIIGRKGGSIGRSSESIIASKAAETRQRINVATNALLDKASRGARKASFAAGPAVLLGHKLFPGGENPKTKDIRVLYAARMDELARAQQPNAIRHAVGDRVATSDPALQDAITSQMERGLKFLASKAPRQTVLPGMLPGDGEWKPSRAQIEEFAKYVHAVNDPASVLEDLAHGHVTLEGAEVLRTVYPALFAQAQRMLLEAAPKMQATLPYPRRVAISIMYRIPIDATMTPRHMQFLQPPQVPAGAPAAGAPPQGGPPPMQAFTGPLQTGQSTMTSLDRRAGS